MIKKYTREEMTQWLIEHFIKHEYEVNEYSKEYLPARVPIFCEKKEKDNKINEKVIEITTDKIITKDDFFPKLKVSGAVIPEASPVRFYQYYFPKAEVYYAYPDYVNEESDEFINFKEVCMERGIGLLRVSKIEIYEFVKPRPLFEEICIKLGNEKKHGGIRKIIGDHLESYLHYLVYYPDPEYRRRAISRRMKEDKEVISFNLIDKLSEIKNIIYKDELVKLASGYRELTGSDYDIAEKFITRLWKQYLGLNYPKIQRRIENILQRDEKYREHFIHQFQVFLIGSYILDTLYPEISKKFNKNFNCKIEIIWLAASTFHDFSYGLQNFDKWLIEFFEDILKVKNKQTKENLNLLNLDAAMIREALFDNIEKITNQLKSDWKNNEKEKLINFFYEKAVIDRNHSVLSAISLIKLYDDPESESRTINENGILQAALGILAHDEDIWEAICGCQGYRRSSGKLPEEKKCIAKCGRKLWAQKKSRIYKEKISERTYSNNLEKYKCEDWEKVVMDRKSIEKIEFNVYPIIFLLIFCDNVQDEGRVTSTDEKTLKDRSSLEDIDIEKKNSKITTIRVKLNSLEQEEKEDEIERMAWCLNDERFEISINTNVRKINGRGGG